MKKYRIGLVSRIAQTVELFAENEGQAQGFAERLTQIDLDFLETNAPDLKHLVFHYSSQEQADDWGVEYVEEFV